MKKIEMIALRMEMRRRMTFAATRRVYATLNLNVEASKAAKSLINR